MEEEGVRKLNCGEGRGNAEDEEVRESKWIRKKPLKVSSDDCPMTLAQSVLVKGLLTMMLPSLASPHCGACSLGSSSMTVTESHERKSTELLCHVVLPLCRQHCVEGPLCHSQCLPGGLGQLPWR